MPNALSMWFVLGSCSMTALQVGELLQRWGPCFDVTVIGWGTISSIPRLPGLSAEELLHELSKVSRFVMNVVSSTNNHVKFQRRYQGQLPSEIMGATESHWAPFSRADPESQRQNRPPHEFPNGSVYEGQWVGPAREGHGVQTWPDGACYTGQWVKDGLQLLIATGDASSGGDNLLTDKAQGMGKFVHAAGDWYEGQYLDDMQHGYGVAMYMDGSKYTGNFWCDKHHGDGVEVWPDGKRFQGTYYQGIKHGQGTFRWPDGSSYIGNFEANNLSGIGTYAWADGRSYTGEWEKNTMHGKGTFSYGDGRSYTGDFFEDVKHGHGVFSWPDGRQYDGEWKNGKRHGKGRRDTAMRTAWSETDRPEVKLWLEKKIGLATFDRSYYYTVDTKQNMFYSAISADLEAARLKEAGYDSVRVQICNIINFFDIQTKPRAARINAAVIRLLERRDVWGAQLLLSRGVAKAFKKPLSSLQTGSCIFDNSSEHALYGQDCSWNLAYALRGLLQRRPRLVTSLLPEFFRRADAGRAKFSKLYRLDTFLQASVQANTVTFNTMQTVLDASGQWAMATLLLDLMGLSTVRPDPQSFNTVISAFSRQVLWTRQAAVLSAFVAWWAAMQQLTESAARGFKFALTGLSAAISACEKGTAWRRAMSTFHTTAIAVQPDLICISAVTSALENCVRWQGAVGSLTTMHQNGHEVDNKSCSAGIGACENACLWARSFVPWKQTMLLADRNTFNAVLASFSGSGQWLHAASLTNEMITSFHLPDEVSCDAAFAACKQASQASAALAFLHSVQSVGLSLLRGKQKDDWQTLWETAIGHLGGTHLGVLRGTSSPLASLHSVMEQSDRALRLSRVVPLQPGQAGCLSEKIVILTSDSWIRSAGILLKQVPHRVHRAIEPSTDAAIVQGAATWSCAGARCHFQGQPFNSIQEVHSTGGALVRRCKHRHWCSCKETEGKWSRGILGNLPWSIQESDSSDEDVSSLEWKPTILSADGSRYTGQWKGSTWQGEGQLELADGSTYEGCFKDGKPHGVGCLKGPDGCVYQGQWRQGRAHGMGKYTKAAGAGTYEGQWMEDKRSGLGTELWADGCLYRGSFQNGCKHGRGFYQTPQGASYNGSFQADQMHGEGVYKFPDGRVYSGSFKSGQMTGYGHMSWPSGAAYEGQYLNGEKHGPGVYTWPDGRAWSQRALATLAGLGLGCALLANKASPTARAAEPAGGRKVCIVGEALFDFLPVKTTDGKQAFLPRPGGAPLNVCIAASRMGAKVSFLGALSSDMFGEELYKTLQADNVDLSMVKRLPNPSTLAFVSKPPGSDVRYAFFKENAADRSLSARGVAELLSGKSFGALHVSLGAITLEDSVLAEAFEQAYKNTHSTKGFTSFDPNLRGPMVKSSPSLYAGRIEAFAQHADLIKSSDADIEFLYGAGADLEAVAKKWLQKGSKLVIVTRGPDGATAYFRGKSGQITSLAVKPPCESPKTIDLEGNPAPVADTVGAGDTCMGTLLCYLLGEDMSMVLGAFARMRYRDREMMFRIAESTPAILGQKLHDFNAAQLGELVYAYARLKLRHQLLLDVLKKRMIEVVKAMRPWHLALVANGFARLQTSDERFFTILASEICRQISEFDGKPLALVANAYARLEVRNRFLLELLGDEAFRRRGVLFFNAPEHVLQNVQAYTTDELCMVGRAYGHFQMAHTPLFECISETLPHHTLALEADQTEEISAQDEDAEESRTNLCDQMHQAAEAYARLTIYHAQTNELLCDAITRRESELVPALVVKVARACAALSFAHPGVLRLATQCMAEHGEQLPEEDFDLLGQALEDLGVLRRWCPPGGSASQEVVVDSKAA
eukprot:s2598_g5.t4